MNHSFKIKVNKHERLMGTFYDGKEWITNGKYAYLESRVYFLDKAAIQAWGNGDRWTYYKGEFTSGKTNGPSMDALIAFADNTPFVGISPTGVFMKEGKSMRQAWVDTSGVLHWVDTALLPEMYESHFNWSIAKNMLVGRDRRDGKVEALIMAMDAERLDAPKGIEIVTKKIAAEKIA